MHILIGLVLAAAPLYFWLLRHWFARVLVFIALMCVSVFVAFLVSYEAPARFRTISAIGAVASWFVSGLPLYVWRHRLAQLQTAQQLRRLP
jgi:uncharacterized membrane protein